MQEAEEAREASAAEFRAERLRLGQESAALKEQAEALKQGIAAHADAIASLKVRNLSPVCLALNRLPSDSSILPRLRFLVLH